MENIRADVDYPPILVTTGNSDDRVVPWHAMKLVAALQHASNAQSQPRLLRLQRGVGHGLGKPTSKVIELETNVLSFLLAAMGVDFPSA